LENEAREKLEVFKQVDFMFQPGNDGEIWFEKSEMKKVVEEIEKKKNYEKIIFEKKMLIEQINKNSKSLSARLEILKCANDHSKPSNFQL